jgi:hypothetical protein
MSYIESLFNDAETIAKKLKCNKKEAFELAIKAYQANSLSFLAHLFRKDGEIQESLSLISKAINNN